VKRTYRLYTVSLLTFHDSQTNEVAKMKTRKLTSLILATAVIAILWVGCKTVTVTTEIKPDGSCIRTIVAEPDSEDIAKTFWPMPIDSTWTIEAQREDKDNYTYKATKTFPSVRKLNSEFAGIEQTDTTVAISCPVKLTKKYRLIFTFLNYEETYKAYNEFNVIPISDSLTIEQQALIDEEDHDNIRDIYSNWIKTNLFEEFYQILLQEVVHIDHPTLTSALFEQHKQEIFRAIDGIDGDTAEEIVPEFLDKIREILHTAKVYELEKPLYTPTRLLLKRALLMADMDDDQYVNKVVMPGRIITTNADTLEGNMAHWEFKPSDWRFKDYTMTVASRVTNWTAIIVSAIVLMLILLIVVTRRIWRHQGNR